MPPFARVTARAVSAYEVAGGLSQRLIVVVRMGHHCIHVQLDRSISPYLVDLRYVRYLKILATASQLPHTQRR
jgi:hypothetical protein